MATKPASEITEAVTYLRVSTDKQGKSGLGLEAQRKAVLDYVASAGLTLVEEFVEIETGKGANALEKRPKLMAALAMAKKRKARLVFAKLDRISRNVHFISGLMEKRIDFVVADMPNASELQLNIYASVAQEEVRAISKRTKEALQAAKDRGQVLGKHGAVLAVQRKAEAMERVEPLRPTLLEMKERGLSMRKMIAELNDKGIASPAGGQWHLANLDRALRRIQEDAVPA
jgi:DNA invertase Pin-like site-specific DNA recombinase